MKRFYRTLAATGILILVVLCLCACGSADGEGKKAPVVPDGFSILGEQDGDRLIIVDSHDNEFVWIPVDGEKVKLTRKTFTDGTVTDLEPGDVIDRIYYGEEDPRSVISDGPAEYTIEAFQESVETFGGFYIGRYETGDETAKAPRTKKGDGSPAVKAGCLPYTFVSRDEALKICRDFYKDQDDIVSSLASSYAWDTALQYLSEIDAAYLEAGKEQAQEKPLPAGESGDEVAGVFDLAGNVSEWTTEYSANGYYHYLSPCVLRGGSWRSGQKDATGRQYNGEDVANEFTGFRMVIYMKTDR